MKNTGKRSETTPLRQKAEELLKKKRLKTDSRHSEADILRLIHELEVHQIELELQNAELLVAKSAAQEAAMNYIELFDFAPIGYFTLSDAGNIKEVNFFGARMLGKERMYLKDALFGFFVSRSSRPIFNQFLEKTIKSGTRESCEITFANHSLLPMRVHLSGMVSGSLGLCHLIAIDITERKRIEEVLQESEKRYRKAQEVGHVGSWEYDIKNDVFWGSDQGKQIYGFTSEYDIFTADEVMKCVIDRDRVNQTLIDLIEKDEPYNIIFDIIPLNSSEKRTMHSIAELVRDKNGIPLKVTGVLHDITDQKKTEAEIEYKNEKLQKLIAEKDKFFSIMAHDLRSPFNAFLGFTRLMVEELPTLTLDQIQKIAVNMRNSATNLFALLENLLEWSRMQRGNISFEPRILLLKSIIAENLLSLTEPANKKQIETRLEIPEDLEVYADSNMLGSIIRNLVSNAIKFTPREGKIDISAKSIAGNSVEISIEDTGIGMNKNMIDNLFHLDTETNRKGTEGETSSGLGLIICKEFIEKHNGKLWVESDEGKGSTFCFSLPAHRVTNDE